MAQIVCENLILGYERRAVAAPINFQVNEGDYLYIVGDNGSGKSTLVKTLLGLCKPLGGTITYAEELRQNEIGYMPQQTMVQRDFPACVEEIVLSGCLNRMGIRPFYCAKEKELATQMLEKMEIINLRKRSYKELSGGQQQRVLLARALCATRKMLLLDEPVAGLDPMATQEFYEVIHKLNQKDNITVLTVSHDIASAMKYATHILQIGEKTPFFGTPEEYQKFQAGSKYAVLSDEE